MRKLLMLASLGLAACGGSQEPEEVAIKPTVSREQALYNTNCKLCHGSKGDLGVSGAANLRKSELSIEERILVITNGRNGMASYKGILDEEEIRLLAEFTMNLHE
jgi:mono/diheme cytochrome c family protein